MPFEITEKAYNQIQSKIIDIESGKKFVRIGVKTVGANGTDFLIGFDSPKNGDLKYNFKYINFLVAPRDLMFVMGMKIDYEIIGNEKGFIFRK